MIENPRLYGTGKCQPRERFRTCEVPSPKRYIFDTSGDRRDAATTSSQIVRIRMS